MKLTPKKLSETWLITDGENRALFIVRKDYSFEVLRIRVRNESFIKEAVKALTNKIPA